MGLLRFHVAKQADRVVSGTVYFSALRKVFHWVSATDPGFCNCGDNRALFNLVHRVVIKKSSRGKKRWGEDDVLDL
jgi:hypothetical protein